MVMAVNNAALLGGQAVIDPSGWGDQFRDGQKLRQEYDVRQQQKALGEIMKIGDHNGRLAAAQQNKYAGALVPAIQKQEQDRLIAEQTYNKGQADINKINAETGKIGAEQGEIGAKTTGLVRENTAGIQNDISALAVTQDPKLFALGLGEMTRQGLITPERTDMMIKMLVSDPQNAAKVMQSTVMANPALATLFKPESKVLDAKDGAYLYTTNGFTGEANEPTAKIGYGQSPDAILSSETAIANNKNTVAGSMYNSDNSLQGTMYSSDNSYNASTFATETASQDRQLKLDQDGKIGWAKISQEQQKLDNPQATRKQIPVSAQKEMSKLYTNLVSNAQTITENGKWMKRLNDGELQLSGQKNFNNTFANRTGITSIGSNPEGYAEFNAYIKDLANKALRLNAGVQTDADYKRQLEAIVSGGGIPKNNGIAITLLNRMQKDFVSQNKATYANYASYKKEYAGIDKPAYGQGGSKPAGNQSGKPSVAQALGKKVFGGS